MVKIEISGHFPLLKMNFRDRRHYFSTWLKFAFKVGCAIILARTINQNGGNDNEDI
jgi:hypothetical protein